MTLRAITGDDDREVYVDRKEMARILGIGLTALNEMVRDQQIPSVTWGIRARRFLPSAVIRALEMRDESDAA